MIDESDGAVSTAIEKIAERHGADILSGIEALAPVPVRREPAYHEPQRRPATKGAEQTVHVGGQEIKRKPLWPMEKAKLDDSATADGRTEPQVLVDSDWEALAEVEVKRSMTFEQWAREACLLPFIEGLDPDYAAAARLFLSGRDMAHRSR